MRQYFLSSVLRCTELDCGTIDLRALLVRKITGMMIIITGFMGSGKSTVASALARRLQCEMIDLDEVITIEAGRSPKQIIEEDEEQAFREIETRTLEKSLANDRTVVIALGGGTWTIKRNRDLIGERSGICVWLDAPFELCWQRIRQANGIRPLAPNRKAALALFTERQPAYDLATLRLEVSEDKNAESIAAEIASLVKAIE